MTKFIYIIIFIFFGCNQIDITKKTTQNSKPNILLIYVDDLGYGDLACQGAKDMRTPNLDALARSGITINNSYANSTVCSPSRAGLLSGKFPDLVGVPGVVRQNKQHNWGYLKEDTVLIPELLNKAGYHTALIGKWHLGLTAPNTPNNKGFTYFKGFLGDMMENYWTHLRGGINWMRENNKKIKPKGHATDLFSDWAINYLEQRKNKKNPFFLFLSYNAPHFPIQPPKEWLNKVIKREKNLSKKRAKNVAFIEHLDFCIGRVMKSLKQTGLIENTLVIFTSDNGGAVRFEQSNGKLRGGKKQFFEGGIKVPTFAYWKNNIKPNSKSNNLVIMSDLFPTFCEIAGVEIPKDLNGISILKTLRGQKQVTDDRFLFWMRKEGGKYQGKTHYAVRYKNFKLLQNHPSEDFQYFNLKNDPYEKQPLIKTGIMYKKLTSELTKHIKKAEKVPWQNPSFK